MRLRPTAHLSIWQRASLWRLKHYSDVGVAHVHCSRGTIRSGLDLPQRDADTRSFWRSALEISSKHVTPYLLGFYSACPLMYIDNGHNWHIMMTIIIISPNGNCVQVVVKSEQLVHYSDFIITRKTSLNSAMHKGAIHSALHSPNKEAGCSNSYLDMETFSTTKQRCEVAISHAQVDHLRQLSIMQINQHKEFHQPRLVRISMRTQRLLSHKKLQYIPRSTRE